MTQPSILIVDDDRDLQKMLGEAFKQEGFAVLQEYGGARALKTAVREQPDLILLDVMTPELRGIEVLRELRRRRVRTRVVVFTGSVRSVEHIVDFVRLGACDYLEKGTDIETLLEGVRRALEVGGTIDTLVTDPSPIVEELSLKAKTLERENESLRDALRVQHLLTVFTRILLVIVAVGLAILLQYFRVVSGGFGFAVLVILLLVLLLPVERIRRLSIKSMKTEGAVEIEELAKAAKTVSRSRHDHATRSARGESRESVSDSR